MPEPTVGAKDSALLDWMIIIGMVVALSKPFVQIRARTALMELLKPVL